MVNSALDTTLIEAIQDGLPVCERPYAAIAERLGTDEADIIARVESLQADGVIKRFGVVVRHRELGFRANAMVVWDIADEQVSGVGAHMAAMDGVTLCYRRPRRRPHWPYNLFCMIHGRDRQSVHTRVGEIASALSLQQVRRAVLFSNRRFKQRGARYVNPAEPLPQLAASSHG